MLSRAASYITDLLIENGKIDGDKQEVYRYGFEMSFAYIINFITTLSIGLLFNMPFESIAFLLSFMTLRTYTGGYHSSSHLTCYIISVTVTVIVLAAGRYIAVAGLNYLGVILAVIGILLMIWLAPVEDKNKPMDDIEKVVFRKRGMRNLLIWVVITAGLYFTPFRSISVTLCVSLFMMGFAVICGLLKNRILDKREQKAAKISKISL